MRGGQDQFGPPPLWREKAVEARRIVSQRGNPIELKTAQVAAHDLWCEAAKDLITTKKLKQWKGWHRLRRRSQGFIGNDGTNKWKLTSVTPYYSEVPLP